MKRTVRILTIFIIFSFSLSPFAMQRKMKTFSSKRVVSEFDSIVSRLPKNSHDLIDAKTKYFIEGQMKLISSSVHIDLDAIVDEIKSQGKDKKIDYAILQFLLVTYLAEPNFLKEIEKLPSIGHFNQAFLFERLNDREKAKDWWPWKYAKKRIMFCWWRMPGFIGNFGTVSTNWQLLKDDNISKYLRKK